MIWGRAVPVPAMGFWGTLLLGAVIGIVALRVLRGTRPRTAGIVAVALAVLVPLSARAITLITFTNGTIADATQVNANFAALTPVTGFNEMISLPAIGAQADVTSPTFVPTRNMTCTVSVEAKIQVPSSTPAGGAFVHAIEVSNGTTIFAAAPPQNGAVATGFASTVAGANDWDASQTRQFTVTAGATVSFGCEVAAFTDFTAAHNLNCIVVYNCL
jgi:hypothetical protein